VCVRARARVRARVRVRKHGPTRIRWHRSQLALWKHLCCSRWPFEFAHHPAHTGAQRRAAAAQRRAHQPRNPLPRDASLVFLFFASLLPWKSRRSHASLLAARCIRCCGSSLMRCLLCAAPIIAVASVRSERMSARLFGRTPVRSAVGALSARKPSRLGASLTKAALASVAPGCGRWYAPVCDQQKAAVAYGVVARRTAAGPLARVIWNPA
jgi:hypothetical protein